ncbi:MAG: hypothetical protein QMC85_00550 [Methanocellales archaeon]|nr:hypothetical protein [Methanocellales archaeon]
MRRETDIWDEGVISIDFAAAIVLSLFVFFFVFYSLSGVIAPYESEYNRMYPIADRVGGILIKDPGFWSNGTDWEDHVDDIKRLGFAMNDDAHNLLSIHKLDAMMTGHNSTPYPSDFNYNDTTGLPFWELSESSANYSSAKNASGVPSANEFYMQIRPINDSTLSHTNLGLANTNSTNIPPSMGDVVKIERGVFIKGNESGGWVYVKYEGKVVGYKLIIWMW